MRSVKSSGGLTHGRGMAESQRAQWLLSMPACASISSAMQEFTSRCYASSGQHKEMTKTRQARDDEDSRTLLGYLWMGRGKNLNPEDWGWLRIQDRLHARTSDQSPAPDNLLKVIRCTCKQGCDSRRCMQLQEIWNSLFNCV